MAKIADEIQRMEVELAELQAAQEQWEASRPVVQQMKSDLQAEIRKLQARVDEHERDPLKAQVAKLKAELRENKANKQVAKLKDRLRMKENIIAREQSLRMNAENKPDVVKDRDKFKAELDGIKGLMKKAGVTLKDMREAVISQAALDLAKRTEQAKRESR